MDEKKRSILLGVLAIAFLGRVLGQVLVLLVSPSWLPPMEEWYSGLIPYPILLSIQIVILVVQWLVSRDIWRGAGYFSRRNPRIGQWVRWFSYLYFFGMAGRYVVTMSLYPENRWFRGCIPILFHWVLAAYLYFLSGFHLEAGGQERE